MLAGPRRLNSVILYLKQLPDRARIPAAINR
jgi:hypothetical protein